jgi:hypothetical protein
MSNIIGAFQNFVNAPEKSGAISLLLRHAFMVWTRITLPLFELGLFFSEHFVLIISVGKFYCRILIKWKTLAAVILMQ